MAIPKRKARLTPEEKARIEAKGLPKQGRARVGKWEPDLERIEELASYGMTQEQIAAACGVDYSTLHAHKITEPDLVLAIRRGQSRGIGEVANSLFQNATFAKNVAAQIFYLKARAQWKDNAVDVGMTPDDIAKALIQQEEAAAKLKDDPEYNHGRVGFRSPNKPKPPPDDDSVK